MATAALSRPSKAAPVLGGQGEGLRSGDGERRRAGLQRSCTAAVEVPPGRLQGAPRLGVPGLPGDEELVDRAPLPGLVQGQGPGHHLLDGALVHGQGGIGQVQGEGGGPAGGGLVERGTWSLPARARAAAGSAVKARPEARQGRLQAAEPVGPGPQVELLGPGPQFRRLGRVLASR